MVLRTFPVPQYLTTLALGAVLALLLAAGAIAGTGGTEFTALETLVTGWTTGALGRALAIIAILVGAGIGIMRGGVMAMLGGIGIAVALSVAVGVIGGILTATV
ncbi:MAG TPA: TraA family conjugative transfer protein [Burkholderiaceae bacterium]|nr:TraA family conjugative transfer protein [Burkholderiaceae bacterium]